MNRLLHIEVIQKNQSCASKDHIKQWVHCFLMKFSSLTPGATITENGLEEEVELKQHVSSISVCDIDHTGEVFMSTVELIYHVYSLDPRGAEIDTMSDTASGEEVPAASLWALPSQRLNGLWRSLVFESGLKEDTLRFALTALELSERGIDDDLVSCNRVVLLHGPPGTGKTSLCRALAQKLSVRLGERFPRATLVEVNAHGLFSKWFSESGKLVSRMFDRIRELLEDPRLLVVVLVDEVESLTHARRVALAGNEPSDSLRAVNAVLTQLDALQRHRNVLVLTTSNVTEAIDAAFVDRADIRRWVGPPGERAAYTVLHSCVEELMRARVLSPLEHLFTLRMLESCKFESTVATRDSLTLLETARTAAGCQLSGRALRKLPVLALALYLPHGGSAPTLPEFLHSLQQAVRDHEIDATKLNSDCHIHDMCARNTFKNSVINGQ